MGARPRGVDGVDPGVGMGAADECRLDHAGQVDIVGEGARAAQQRRVFEPRHARPEHLRTHY